MRHFSSIESRPTHPRNNTKGESLSDLLPPASNQQGAGRGPSTMINSGPCTGTLMENTQARWTQCKMQADDASKQMSGETCRQHGSMRAVWRDDACFDATADRRLIPHDYQEQTPIRLRLQFFQDQRSKAIRYRLALSNRNSLTLFLGYTKMASPQTSHLVLPIKAAGKWASFQPSSIAFSPSAMFSSFSDRQSDQHRTTSTSIPWYRQAETNQAVLMDGLPWAFGLAIVVPQQKFTEKRGNERPHPLALEPDSNTNGRRLVSRFVLFTPLLSLSHGPRSIPFPPIRPSIPCSKLLCHSCAIPQGAQKPVCIPRQTDDSDIDLAFGHSGSSEGKKSQCLDAWPLTEIMALPRVCVLHHTMQLGAATLGDMGIASFNCTKPSTWAQNTHPYTTRRVAYPPARLLDFPLPLLLIPPSFFSSSSPLNFAFNIAFDRKQP
ncbi:uncharacterized protein CLUP02_15436 [Colletotrichum lupini]|uniref:Uncharacterized protein n=1 Tax=Colletotrichum lupini TaxID=145971 RepID=A0A9Q8T6V9_9PEZI|nr:uncharacterized protein CLUP02_15436 [Colletotrichum lupini]UQC89905.1 hypothetical protein CLUP02_15436 [Colletotrichum lupini]